MSERAPLLGTPTGAHDPADGSASAPARRSSLGTAPVPTTAQSVRWFIFNSYINVFLVFVPLGFLAEKLEWSALSRFTLNFLAIVPLAKLLGDATEQVSMQLGETLGGLLNATFGNAVELIVGIVALLQGELRIVQTSLIGSILSNLLLVLGMSFCAGGMMRKENVFQATAAQASGSILLLGTITLVIPAAYRMSGHSTSVEDEAGLLFISRGTSIILVTIYGLYLLFQLKTHSFLWDSEAITEAEFNLSEEEDEMKMNTRSALLALVVVTFITSFSADYLVGAIDQVANEYHIPKAFISTILLPIVGNAAEHVTSIWMAVKDKMEIALGVAVGSSIQIGIGLIPTLVLVGWAVHQPLTLYFQGFETVVLTAGVLLTYTLIQDGKSNWIEGSMLVALYLVISLAFWVN